MSSSGAPFPFDRFLRCPRCEHPLAFEGRSLRCDARHTYDLAREGYVHLALDSRLVQNADTARMVDARLQFLRAGHYGPLTRALATRAAALLASQDPEGCVLDAGAGPGHYLAQVLDAAPGRLGLALDLSKFAARRAARAHSRIGSIVADLSQPLPVKSHVAALALSIFAPRPAEELHRTLLRGAPLLTVTPGPRHLGELIDRLGLMTLDPKKDLRLRERMNERFDLRDELAVEHPLEVTRTEVATLVGMGPNAFHLSEEEIDRRVQALPDRFEVTAAFRIHEFVARAP